MIKLVAFDWNGTLFADTKATFESNNAAFKIVNLKPVSFHAFQKYFDVPVTKYFLSLGVPEKEINEKGLQISKAFHATYEPKATKVRTRAFAKEVLKWLGKNNISAVIFSNHIQDKIELQLKRLKITKYVSEVIANSHIVTTLKTRGKKDNLKGYLIKNHILPSETLIIGDTIEEVEIGKELGCKTVAITQGNCSTARLKAAYPDYLIHSLKEVINIIKGNYTLTADLPVKSLK